MGSFDVLFAPFVMARLREEEPDEKRKIADGLRELEEFTRPIGVPPTGEPECVRTFIHAGMGYFVKYRRLTVEECEKEDLDQGIRVMDIKQFLEGFFD